MGVTTTVMIMMVMALVLLVILIAIAVALMERLDRIELLTGDLLSYTIEKINLEEAGAKSKPPDTLNPQALSDEHKTPMVKRAAERLYRRRIEG